MKFKATIFVEGEADIRFVECFVKQRFDYELKKGIELQNSKGKDALKLLQKNFQENTKLEIANLLIFDANGSYNVRKKELIQIREQLSIEFNDFLFPSDKDPGDLETILENIINPAYKNVLNCFDQFQNCLNTIGSQQIRLPDRKDKIYMYASLLSTNELAKERKRDYLNKSLWDLESFHLDPLYNFLKPHFTEE